MTQFKDIKCPALRAWNQIQYAMELTTARGEEEAESYFEALSKPEKYNFTIMASRMAVLGSDFVQKEVMNFSK